MTMQPEEFLAMQAQADHAQAEARGQRIQDLASYCVGELIVEGYLPSEHRIPARTVLFPILADVLYGNLAVDIPPRRETP